MIFKVSFKETEKNPSKIVVKKGKTTIVTLKGTVELPKFWSKIPEEIIEWIASLTYVELYENISCNTMTVFSEGIAKCSEEDKYDSLLGERLAEAKAKECIYKFFYNLCYRLYDYYSAILFGNPSVAADGDGNSLYRALYKYEKLYEQELKHQKELLENKDNG